MTETLVRSLVDPDFGRIDLIETATSARLDGGPWEPLVYRNWRSTQVSPTGEEFFLSLTSAADPPDVSKKMRAQFKKVLEKLQSLKEKIAASQLQLARDWARQANRFFLRLNAEVLTNSLVLSAIVVSSGRIDISFRDSLDVFAGHEIEARLTEEGEILEIVIAG